MIRHILIYIALCCTTAVVWSQTPTVVINEVMYDDTAVTELEWIELHNTTGAAVNVGDWIVTDASSYPPASEGAIRIPTGTTIPANGYIVLSWNAIAELEGEVVCTVYFGTILLGNGGDNLALYNAQTGGTLIDGSLTSNFPDQAPSEAGYSVEKCNENSGWSSISSNWHASTNVYAATGRYRRCTPGATNSVCPDVTAPDMDSVVVLSNTQLDVYFNENVELVSSETESFYVVSLGVGSPTSALRDGTVNRLVHLTFPPIPNNTYSLTVTGVADLSGNVANGRIEFFEVDIQAGPSPVVVTEIMYDDTGSIDLEWVELHNRTASSADISGWVLIDASSYPPGVSEGGWLVPAATQIPAGAYRVLGITDLPGMTGEIVCTHYDSTFDLNNAGDNCALYDLQTGGILRDGSLTLTFPDLVFANSGYAIEKCNADSGWTNDPAAWHISSNSLGLGRYRRGTPGTANTACTGDAIPPALDSARVITNQLVDVYFSETVELYTAQTLANYVVSAGIGNPATATRQTDTRVVRLTFGAGIPPAGYVLTVNNVEDIAANRIPNGSSVLFTIAGVPQIKFTEVMCDPNFAGAADSSGEWFEIYNLSGSTVNMGGWILSDNQGSDTLEGTVNLTAGQYFVFAARGDSIGNGGIPEHYDYKWGSSGWGLSLDNAGETITLRNTQNSLVAQINYTNLPDATGRSAQLRDPNLNPAIDANWCQAIGAWAGAWNNDWGTPRAAAICPDETPPVILSATTISNAAVDVLYDEAVSQVSAETESNYDVTPAVGSPLSAMRDGGNPALVHLTFNPLPPNTYLLTVNNVADLVGNVCVDEHASFLVSGAAEGILGVIRSSDLGSAIISWDFGVADCPDTVSQWFLLRNFGTATLTVTPPMTVGTGHFFVNSNCAGIFGLNPAQVSTCSLRVRFAANARGAYEDTLRIQTNAANAVGGYLKIPLTGTWSVTPDETDAVVIRSGNDARLTWNHVRQSTGGCPLTADSYTIFFNSTFEGTYSILGSTADSTYTHVGAFGSGARNFYKIVAVDN